MYYYKDEWGVGTRQNGCTIIYNSIMFFIFIHYYYYYCCCNFILPKNRKCCPTDTGNGWWNSAATDGRYPGARPHATWWTETATPAPWVWPSSTWAVSATLLGPRNALARRQTGARCRTAKSDQTIGLWYKSTLYTYCT